MNTFLEAVAKRRSRYVLGGGSPISDERIEQIIELSVKDAPTAFNSQSGRVLVLFAKKHLQFWALTKEILRAHIPADQFSSTDKKIKSFSAARGTLLYFEDWTVVEALEAKFPLYKEQFATWAYQANAMLEYMIWTALEAEGLGASLQHYNPLVDETVRTAFDVPTSWKLVAQMPFGMPEAPAEEKTFLPLGERVKILK